MKEGKANNAMKIEILRDRCNFIVSREKRVITDARKSMRPFYR